MKQVHCSDALFQLESITIDFDQPLQEAVPKVMKTLGTASCNAWSKSIVICYFLKINSALKTHSTDF